MGGGGRTARCAQGSTRVLSVHGEAPALERWYLGKVVQILAGLFHNG